MKKELQKREECLHTEVDKILWMRWRLRLAEVERQDSSPRVSLIRCTSKHGQNLAAQATEKPDHGGLDEVAALIWCLGHALVTKILDETDTAGHRWTCWVASSSKVVARTVDLRSAYI
eukprot:6159289-Amphidinium_carterae.1